MVVGAEGLRGVGSVLQYDTTIPTNEEPNNNSAGWRSRILKKDPDAAVRTVLWPSETRAQKIQYT